MNGLALSRYALAIGVAAVLLYGSTIAAGNTGCTFGCGTVFSVITDGRKKVLYRFAGGTDGWQPNAPLISVNGTLYSTTSQGGTYNHGTIFALSP